MDAGYTLLDIINSRRIDLGTLAIGGSLLSAGLLARWLIKDTIKIRKGQKLVIVQ